MHVQQACDVHHVTGSDIRQLLSTEITSKVLMRRARDVVLLSGQTGCGKELAAATCHDAARTALGRRGELVQINCANLRGGLFESELFGYRRGAFTGADRDHAGLVCKADDGTLVLDEIQSLQPEDQARLLRFLGEREYRAVGDHQVKSTNALIILSTNRDLVEMVQSGEFRRDVLDRATAKIAIPSLYERRRDIGELAQEFAVEAASELGAEQDSFMGLTRRARADVETAVIRYKEVSVRRLRELIRDAVFSTATDGVPEALDSEMVLPVLERELNFTHKDRQQQDLRELQDEFDLLVGRGMLEQLAGRHHISSRALSSLVRGIHGLIEEMDDQPRSYRNVVERTNRLAKVALWVVSGAKTQADFRRFFGDIDRDKPTKSVAHQVFYEVFPKDDDS